ncbi:hypothetical protein DL93DRAFT_2094605 [Clavulina sp. PMI_390]|nr:hypothetical protein DL93DRAFT_2094605 [Clavulina sp. PMI_390]
MNGLSAPSKNLLASTLTQYVIATSSDYCAMVRFREVFPCFSLHCDASARTRRDTLKGARSLWNCPPLSIAFNTDILAASSLWPGRGNGMICHPNEPGMQSLSKLGRISDREGADVGGRIDDETLFHGFTLLSWCPISAPGDTLPERLQSPRSSIYVMWIALATHQAALRVVLSLTPSPAAVFFHFRERFAYEFKAAMKASLGKGMRRNYGSPRRYLKSGDSILASLNPIKIVCGLGE